MQFEVNTWREDPYKNFKFLVYFGNSTDPVAGVSRVGRLAKTTTPVEHREGGDNSTNRKSPGRTSYEAITLERGVTHDREFETWANAVNNYQGDPLMWLRNFRRDIRIVMLNEAGQPVKGYNVYRCWVSEYQALPELDAGGEAVAIEHIQLENEGWERNLEITEPTEPSGVVGVS
jgi:phage tail-like protein